MSRRLTALAAAGILGLGPACEALAQACPLAEQEAAARQAAEQKMATFELTRDCAMIPEVLAAVQEHTGVLRLIERQCPQIPARRDTRTQSLETEMRQFCEAKPMLLRPAPRL